MTKTTTNLLGIVITILAGIYFYISCCSTCGATTSKEEPEKEVMAPITQSDPTRYPIAIDDGDFNLEIAENFDFELSSNNYLTPISANIETSISTDLKDYLSNNPDKIVDITGYYKSDENNRTAFPNLGFARANAVKNYFVSKNIASSQININGELNDQFIADGNILRGPVSYSLSQVSENEESELQTLYDRINEEPLILQFNTAEASIELGEAQRQKIADIVRYLDKVEDAQCQVVGYTDSQGSASTNLRLGQERADFAKSYLVNNGLAENRIETSSKGQANPIAGNDTEEGRAQNRRTVITIK